MNESVPPNSRPGGGKNIDPEALAIVRDAANAAGVEPHEWLNRAILENAGKAGAAKPVPAPGAAATADKSAEAIAQQLEQARAAAKAQGIPLGEWLNRAILANAKNVAPPPGLTAVGGRAGLQSLTPAHETSPTKFMKRSHAGGVDPKDLQRVRDALARADHGDKDIDPTQTIAAASAETRRRRGGRPLMWSALCVLLLVAIGIWTVPELMRRKPQWFAWIQGSQPLVTATLPKKDDGAAPTTRGEATPGRPPAPPSDTAEAPKINDPGAPDKPPVPGTPAPPADATKPNDTAEAPKPGDTTNPGDSANATPPTPPADTKPAAPPSANTDPPKIKDPSTAETTPRPPTPPANPDSALAKVPAKDMPRPAAQNVDWYRRAANAGNPDAQYALAELHLKGDGVPKDFEAAAKLFQRSAETGKLARSQYALGLLYARGLGVAKNDVDAVLWWQKAAAQGHNAAITQVGIALLTGRGIAKDTEAARRMLERAAEGDEVNAQYTLGRMYETGDSVRRDPVIAMKWFILAAEQAHPYATQKVEELSTALPRDQQERATELVSEHYRRFRKRS